MAFGLVDTTADSIEIIPLRRDDLEQWMQSQSASTREWITENGFQAEAHTSLRIPSDSSKIVLGLGSGEDRWSFAGLPTTLPLGTYRIGGDLTAESATRAALGWALGSYRFTRYRKAERDLPSLCYPKGADREAVQRAADATYFARDLANIPVCDMGPQDFAKAASSTAEMFGAECTVTEGDALLDAGYRLVHTVGRASARQPVMIDMRWGALDAPKVTLVGKGVCFDTGGINIKNWGSMINMKVDMAGGAHALALARMIMQSNLPVRLRVLVPAVENSISGNAMMPRDIVRAYNGTTVEIGHTDAEGRLILADALAAACTDSPNVILDFATLTSTSTVCLGPDVPALYSNDDSLADALGRSARKTEDPMWRMPLWRDYLVNLKGHFADLNTVADQNLGFTTSAGAIYASLFLDCFVDRNTPWAHLDINAYNSGSRPGRPEGAEARGLLAAFDYLSSRYGQAAGKS